MKCAPWQLLAVVVAGWMSRQQQEAIDYLREENRVLREKLGVERVRLNDDQRRRLAVRGKIVGRQRLAEVCSIVTPDTILRWHRRLIAKKYDRSAKRGPGRPGVMQEIKLLIVRMAEENMSWGYRRIQGALDNVGHRVSRSTVSCVLKENGIDPAPERNKRTPWSMFLKAHWGSIAAADVFTVEVWTSRGLVRHFVFFVIDLSTRQVEIAGITAAPCGGWMEQVARNLTDPFGGFLRCHKYFIHDRDPLFTAAFVDVLRSAGIDPMKLPPRSPNLNAHAERFVRSIKSECTDRMIFFGEQHLRGVIDEYMVHYHQERNHQGVENQLLIPDCRSNDLAGRINRCERLGGMLNYYQRKAA